MRARSRHPGTLTSINNLGMLLKDQGDLDGAAPLLREALQAKRETLGECAARRHYARARPAWVTAPPLVRRGRRVEARGGG